MDRREELTNLFKKINEDKQILISKLIDEVVYLEERITEIKKYPLYRVGGGKVHSEEALKVYKDLSNQYNVDIKTLMSFLTKQEMEEASPLLKFLENEDK